MLHAMPQPPILGERNNRSVRSILMPTVIPPASGGEDGVFHCSSNGTCTFCSQHVIQSGTFTSHTTGESFHIRHHMTCMSKNIIYILFCDKCNHTQYVGQTQQTLKLRFNQHFSNIRKNTGTLVTHHFNKQHHSLFNLKCMPIEQVHTDNTDTRLNRERFWITKLRTLSPRGMNMI